MNTLSIKPPIKANYPPFSPRIAIAWDFIEVTLRDALAGDNSPEFYDKLCKRMSRIAEITDNNPVINAMLIAMYEEIHRQAYALGVCFADKEGTCTR